VAHSFSIAHSVSAVLADPDLEELICVQTGNAREANSIVRSIRRFGVDASITHYDVTPHQGRGTRHDTRAVSWSVRAVRP
jgi:hypothetical protein